MNKWILANALIYVLIIETDDRNGYSLILCEENGCHNVNILSKQIYLEIQFSRTYVIIYQWTS